MCLVPRDALRPLPRKLTTAAMCNTEQPINYIEELPLTVQELAAKVLEAHATKDPPCDGCFWIETFGDFADHSYGCQATTEKIVELHLSRILDDLDKPLSTRLKIQLSFAMVNMLNRSEVGTLV